ncbi:MAG: hypothetical protein SGI72_07985 [Planctomycetota bacterium]|nr:hypothetical protein [Planctomycetota bacterium]
MALSPDSFDRSDIWPAVPYAPDVSDTPSLELHVELEQHAASSRYPHW